MSPTLLDTSPVFADPTDGLAILEQKSVAESYGIPLAVLLELAVRCNAVTAPTRSRWSAPATSSPPTNGRRC